MGPWGCLTACASRSGACAKGTPALASPDALVDRVSHTQSTRPAECAMSACRRMAAGLTGWSAPGFGKNTATNHRSPASIRHGQHRSAGRTVSPDRGERLRERERQRYLCAARSAPRVAAAHAPTALQPRRVCFLSGGQLDHRPIGSCAFVVQPALALYSCQHARKQRFAVDEQPVPDSRVLQRSLRIATPCLQRPHADGPAEDFEQQGSRLLWCEPTPRLRSADLLQRKDVCPWA